MAQTSEAPTPGIGHNIREIRDDWAELNEELPQYLDVKFASLIKRSKILLEAMTRAPSVVNDDNAARVSDQIGQIKELTDEAEAARELLNKPILKAQRTVNGFFAQHFDVLNETDKKKTPGWKQKLEALITKYQIDKVNAETVRRQEEERKAREAAAEAQRIADEERRRAEEIARKAAEDAAAAADAIANEQDLEKALELEEQEKARAAAATAEADKKAKDAEAAAAAAAAALRATQVTGAKMHQGFGDYGTSFSLRKNWRGRIINRAEMDLNLYRDLFNADELQRVVDAFAKKHENTVKHPGVEFFNDQKSTVRG